jgi:hypothetical protein
VRAAEARWEFAKKEWSLVGRLRGFLGLRSGLIFAAIKHIAKEPRKQAAASSG